MAEETRVLFMFFIHYSHPSLPIICIVCHRHIFLYVKVIFIYGTVLCPWDDSKHFTLNVNASFNNNLSGKHSACCNYYRVKATLSIARYFWNQHTCKHAHIGFFYNSYYNYLVHKIKLVKFAMSMTIQ